MKKRLFPLLIALSALSVAGSAAFYSVFGLSKLFAGAATQVIIMAGSLEFAKLVAASLIYQYWDTINKVLRGYLMIAVFTLMVITSGGIYGFLSGAYQSTAVQSELLDKGLAVLNQKQIRFEETKDDLKIEKNQLTKSISDLRISLSNPTQVQYYDAEAEQVITTSSSSARRALQSELKLAIVDRDNINIKLEAVIDSITKTDIALLNREISNEDERELGPLKYLAGITGWSMDKVVNWFLLLIIFVFDPLAIALVVATNFAFGQIRKPKKEDYFSKRNEQLDKVAMSAPEGKEFNKSYPMPFPDEALKQRVKENQEKLKKEKITYPKFVEKHYPKTEINTYGEDDWATPTKEEEITLDGGEIEVTVEPTKEQMEELKVHEGKKFQKGLDTAIQVMEEEEKEKERVIEVRDDGGHRITYRDKEDIYKDKPKPKISKRDLGRIPKPSKNKPKNL